MNFLKKIKLILKLKWIMLDKRKIVISGFCIMLLLFTYCFINYKELVAVYNLQKSVSKKTNEMEIVLGGEAVGIKLLATGVLVMGIDRDDTLLKIRRYYTRGK